MLRMPYYALAAAKARSLSHAAGGVSSSRRHELNE
jgi:hypothetical protein